MRNNLFSVTLKLSAIGVGFSIRFLFHGITNVLNTENFISACLSRLGMELKNGGGM